MLTVSSWPSKVLAVNSVSFLADAPQTLLLSLTSDSNLKRLPLANKGDYPKATLAVRLLFWNPVRHGPFKLALAARQTQAAWSNGLRPAPNAASHVCVALVEKAEVLKTNNTWHLE